MEESRGSSVWKACVDLLVVTRDIATDDSAGSGLVACSRRHIGRCQRMRSIAAGCLRHVERCLYAIDHFGDDIDGIEMWIHYRFGDADIDGYGLLTSGIFNCPEHLARVIGGEES